MPLVAVELCAALIVAVLSLVPLVILGALGRRPYSRSRSRSSDRLVVSWEAFRRDEAMLGW